MGINITLVADRKKFLGSRYIVKEHFLFHLIDVFRVDL